MGTLERQVRTGTRAQHGVLILVPLPSLLHAWHWEVVLVEPEPNSHAAWDSDQGGAVGLVVPPPPRAWGHCPRYERVERIPHLRDRWKEEG